MNFSVNDFFPMFLKKKIMITRQKIGAGVILPVPERSEHA